MFRHTPWYIVSSYQVAHQNTHIHLLLLRHPMSYFRAAHLCCSSWQLRKRTTLLFLLPQIKTDHQKRNVTQLYLRRDASKSLPLRRPVMSVLVIPDAAAGGAAAVSTYFFSTLSTGNCTCFLFCFFQTTFSLFIRYIWTTNIWTFFSWHEKNMLVAFVVQCFKDTNSSCCAVVVVAWI